MVRAPIGVGILGTGLSASMHVQALRAVPGVQVVAVAGTSLEKAAAFARKWEVPRAVVGLEGLLAEPAVQVVHLCTPPYLHPAEVRACAAAGRHILVEKPMARTVAEADGLIETCQRAGVTLGCMFQYRFMPLSQRARAGLAAGRLGRPLVADVFVKWWRGPEYYRSSTWRATREKEGGGVLINQAIHALDLVQWLVGPVVAVQGLVRTALHAIETEDLGLALLHYTGGAVGVLAATTIAYPGFPERIEVHGERGTMLLSPGQGRLEWYLKDRPEPLVEGETAQQQAAAQDPARVSLVGHIAQFTDFYQALREGRAPAVDGREGRRALAVVEAVYRSSAEGRPVALADLDRPGRPEG